MIFPKTTNHYFILFLFLCFSRETDLSEQRSLRQMKDDNKIERSDKKRLFFGTIMLKVETKLAIKENENRCGTIRYGTGTVTNSEAILYI